jgi:hypothetical protein
MCMLPGTVHLDLGTRAAGAAGGERPWRRTWKRSHWFDPRLGWLGGEGEARDRTLSRQGVTSSRKLWFRETASAGFHGEQGTGQRLRRALLVAQLHPR